MNEAAVFRWPVRVYWEDTDAGGIVFYANYLKFFERARTEWLRHLGLEQHNLRAETGGMFVVASTEMKYLRPAQLDDLLQITAQVRELDRVSMTLHQEAWRLQNGQPVTLLCEGSIRIVWVEAERMRASRIPESIAQLFQAE